MPQSFASIYMHIVFSTKHRQPIIAPEWEDRLYGVVGGSLRTVKSMLLCAGGVEDHVHLLVSIARDLSVSNCVRDIKTDSSSWVHQELGIPDFEWQRGYSAFSVSHSQAPEVRKYLGQQKERHPRQSYQDEVRLLLRLHDIKPDEEHMWD